MKRKLCQQDKVLIVLIMLVAGIFVIVSPFLIGTANSETYAENRVIESSLNSYTQSYELSDMAMEASHRLYLDYLVKKGNMKKLDEDSVANALLSNADDLSKDQKEVLYQVLVTDAENSVYEKCSYFISDEDGTIYSNSKELTKIQSSGDKKHTKLGELAQQSWMYSFKFNSKGEQETDYSNVKSGYVDEKSFSTIHDNFGYSEFYDEKGNSILKWKPVTNVSIMIEIPMSVLLQDDISLYDLGTVSTDSTYTEYFCIQYLIFAGVLFLLVFSLPSKKMRKSHILTITSGTIPSIALCFIQIIALIMAFTMGKSLLYRIGTLKPLTLLFAYIVTAILLTPIALLGVSAKKYYLQGTKKEGEEESLLYSGILKISCRIKGRVMGLTDIRIHDIRPKKIIFVTLVNLFVILFLLFLYLLDGSGDTLIFVFLLILYSVGFYWILAKNLYNKQRDYQILNEVIKDIIHNDEDEVIKQNLGTFEPMKPSLENLKTDFKEAVEQEVQSQKMKTELITNVSHDLKTPLTSIISYVDLLKNEKLSKKEREKYINVLDSSSNRLKQLIENLFEISKANSGNVSLDFMDVDIISMLKQAEVECEAQLHKRNLILRNQFADDKVLVSLDSQKTYRIFENLLSNVAKYALENTRVYVKVEDFGNMVEVSIKNVSQEELDFDPDEIMERFTRGDKSRNSEGSGLGLAIAKSFSELQNGSLKLSIDGDLFKVSVRFYRTVEEE